MVRVDLAVPRAVLGLRREARGLRSERGLDLAHVLVEHLAQRLARANHRPACVRQHVLDSGAAANDTRRAKKAQ